VSDSVCERDKLGVCVRECVCMIERVCVYVYVRLREECVCMCVGVCKCEREKNWVYVCESVCA